MNLSKRASFLILPVILVSYTLAALIIYQQQRESLYHLEQNQLEHSLSQLQKEFNFYNGFVDAYQLSLIEGDVLASFIREPSNIYRGHILTANMEASIERYFGRKNVFVSLSIIDKKSSLNYYVENSTDPFAKASPEQFNLASEMQTQQLLQSWQHIQKEQFSIIQKGVAIDPRTFAPPLVTDMEHSIQIISTVKPLTFDQHLSTLLLEYNANIEFLDQETGSTTESHMQLGGAVQLREDYFIQVTPHSEYLSGKLAILKQKLFLLFSISSIVTFALLQLLIRHFITNPISQLDRQLTAVEQSKQKEITYPKTNDEISRLGERFSKLHGDLTASLEESRLQSRTDALTQLPNRASFNSIATKMLTHAGNHDERVTIIYLDLDNFKFVNDKHGHEIGDKLLKSVASHLNHTVTFFTQQKENPYPQVFRLSGDEFIILVKDKEPELLEKLTTKILNLFTNGYSFELGCFPVTASLGIAHFPQDGSSLSQLVSNADLAMYQAKKTGKNRQSVYSKELAKKDRELKEIESRLKAINFDDEFALNYMPIITTSGEVKGCEALLRWYSPDLGLVCPGTFIPIAESTGLFEKIDLWVIKHVFQELSVLKTLLGNEIEISINISSAELNSDHFTSKVTALEKQHNIQTSNIIFEITETFAAEQEQSALDWLQKLREPGYKIAIDDFGTGYTSLMQMVEYPVDIIKFDRQLTERIARPEKKALAKSLVDLCHLQGLKVVAEGVETLEQFNLLKEVNCNYLQGYLIAKPMHLDELVNWINSNNQESTKASANQVQ